MENGISFKDIQSMDADAFFSYLERMSESGDKSDEETEYMSAVEFFNQF